MDSVMQNDSIDQNLLRAIESLSIGESSSTLLPDDNLPYSDELFTSNGLYANQHLHSNSTNTSSSNASSPTFEQLHSQASQTNNELESAASSLLSDLNYTYRNNQTENNYDKQKFLVAVLGNTDIITDALKKIRQLLGIGKRMEEIYREYYVNPYVHIDLQELSSLIESFSKLYDEKYVREVKVTRVYDAFCQKMIQIYKSRTTNNHCLQQ